MNELFRRFNRKGVDDRTIDTLIGLSKGMLADGKVCKEEADFLLTWLIQARQRTDLPVIVNLYERLTMMLQDDILDSEESAELVSILRRITGDDSEVGELGKSTKLPIDTPEPNVTFEGRSFLFTGTFAFGVRRHCQEAILARGATVAKSVTKSLNYLVLGTYVTDTWAHENFGRKIEKAIEYRNRGVPIAIVTEEHWANCGSIRVD